MNKDNQNTMSDANVDAYEEKAVNRSKLARNIAIGAAIAGGGAVAATAAAATVNHTPEVLEDVNEDLTMEDLTDAATVSEAPEPEVEVVHVSQPAPAPAPAPAEPEIVWEETQEIYIDGERFISMESGSVDGQKFALVDVDNDNLADVIGIDVNNNGVIEENELFEADPTHRLAMGNETSKVTRDYYYTDGNGSLADVGDNRIHNDFEDEKTGESYHGDYAENNPDYNPNAHYTAGMELPEDENTVADGYAMNDTDVSDDSTFDMGGEESFLG